MHITHEMDVLKYYVTAGSKKKNMWNERIQESLLCLANYINK